MRYVGDTVMCVHCYIVVSCQGCCGGTVMCVHCYSVKGVVVGLLCVCIVACEVVLCCCTYRGCSVAVHAELIGLFVHVISNG